LTFDATLAELTSLEELLKAMMADGQIHYDVIKKLWQVYSEYMFPGMRSKKSLSESPRGTDKDISRQQRRGAIIILGMIAGAKRQIVTDRVDTLLNVGLGPRGKVCKVVHGRILA
jgi:condensin complex subunit 1